MMTYRMHRSVRAANSYIGAREAGGRWNPIGTPMLYTSQYLSLACMEILVHLDKTQLPRDYVWSMTELPENPTALEFQNLAVVTSCQEAGLRWVNARTGLAAQVPSVVVPQESNILLNPNHPDYLSLAWSEPQQFRFDPRLFTAEPQIF